MPFPIPAQEQVHILSPFDPLIIQRKRLRLFFDYEYRFEAYVPKHKRVFGYFVCPVLIGDRIVAALDLKTDRSAARTSGAALALDRPGRVPRPSAAGGSRVAQVRAISVGPELDRALERIGRLECEARRDQLGQRFGRGSRCHMPLLSLRCRSAARSVDCRRRCRGFGAKPSVRPSRLDRRSH